MEWIIAIEASGPADWMRTSSWAYPAVNLLHVAGVILLVGGMLLLDLRILGAGRKAISLHNASALLTPLAVAGLITMLASGSLLFMADAVPLLGNPLFLPKIVLIGLGILNALAFQWLWRASTVNTQAQLPMAAKLQAALSLAIWLSAAALGRLLAYV